MERIDIRISTEVKEMLRDIAEADSRSLTKEIEHLIIQKYKQLMAGINEEDLQEIADLLEQNLDCENI